MVAPSAPMTRSVIGLTPMQQRSLLMVKLKRQWVSTDQPPWCHLARPTGWIGQACDDGSDAALASQPVQAGPRGSALACAWANLIGAQRGRAWAEQPVVVCAVCRL